MLLVVALLGAGGPVAAAHAQGAGDQQYQDPFGGDDSGSSGSSGSGNSGSGSSGSSDDGDITPLSPSPQTSGGGSATGSTGTPAGTGAAATTTPSATAGTLPDTGLDTRVLLLAGAVLVLLGAGLRMRNAPERF